MPDIPSRISWNPFAILPAFFSNADPSILMPIARIIRLPHSRSIPTANNAKEPAPATIAAPFPTFPNSTRINPMMPTRPPITKPAAIRAPTSCLPISVRIPIATARPDKDDAIIANAPAPAIIDDTEPSAKENSITRPPIAPASIARTTPATTNAALSKLPITVNFAMVSAITANESDMIIMAPAPANTFPVSILIFPNRITNAAIPTKNAPRIIDAVTMSPS